METLKSELKIKVITEGTEEYLEKIEELKAVMDKLNALIKELNALPLKVVLDSEQ